MGDNMAKLIIGGLPFKSVSYEKEEEIEKVVVNNSKLIFGNKTIYFDLKKGIRSNKEGVLSIPDGYLLSFMSGDPILYVVENELSTHDIYTHIGMHFLKYHSSFSEGSRMKVKNYLLEYAKQNKEILNHITRLIKDSKFSNASELLDYVVFEKDYGFLVAIDEATDELYRVLKSFNPEIIEIKKFVSEEDNTKIVYLFDGFQEEVTESIGKLIKEIADVDTLVCPANEEGFEEVFIKQDRWYAIRISPSMISQIKFIAMYETSPVSSIRWGGEVVKIEKCIRPGYENSGKYEVFIKNKRKIRPLTLSSEENTKGIAPQGPRYTKLELIEDAKKLSDIF